MMGSGKSVTGKALAVMLDYSFVDLDNEIEKQEKRKISEIFAASGEPYFRELESTVLERCSKQGAHVFATGGGIILRDKNVDCMKATGKVVLLKASIETLWQRLRYAKDRPLLNKPDPLGALGQILSDREVLYEKACHFLVATDGKLADEVAQEIYNRLRPKK